MRTVVATIAAIALFGWIVSRPDEITDAARLAIYAAVVAGELFLLWLVCREAALRELVGPARAMDIPIATLFFFVVFYLTRVFAGPQVLWPRTKLDFALWVVVSIVAGFVEEVVFRGYLQARIGLVPQALIFGAAHAYQGWRNVLVITILGLLFGALAAWRKSRFPGILAHAAIDLWALAALATSAR